MKKPTKANSGKPSALRKKAEKMHKSTLLKKITQLTEDEALKLVHEFEVHQIELELQNEELVLAKAISQASSDKYTDLYDFSPAGYFTLSSGGKIIELNLKGSVMLGKERSLLKNSLFKSYLEPESLPGFDNLLKTVFKKRSNESYQLVLSGREKNRISILIRAVYSEDLDACLLTALDISDRVKAEEKMRLMAYMLDNAPESITVHDFDGRFLYANQKTFDLHAYTAEEFMALNLKQVDAPVSQKLIAERMKLLEEKGEATFEVIHLRKDGTELPLEVHTLLTNWGGKEAILSIGSDITERKKTEEILIEKEERLSKAQKVAHLGSWKWNIKENNLEWSDEMFNIFGIDKNKFSGNLSEVITKAIHPDDRPAVEISNQSVSTRGVPIPLEYRIIRPDGSIRNVWAEAGEIVKDVNNIPISLSGIVLDLTERRKTEDALRESEEKYRLLIENIGEGIGITDTNEIFVFANPAAEKIFQTGPGELTGKSLKSFLSPESLKLVLDESKKRSEKAASSYENEIILPNGTKKYLIVTATPRISTNGDFIGTFAVFRDINLQKEAEMDLKENQKKLGEKLTELELINNLMVDRELKMIELKTEINELLEKQGAKPKYRIVK